MSERVELAARLVVGSVAEVLSGRHGWDINQTLSKMSKNFKLGLDSADFSVKVSQI